MNAMGVNNWPLYAEKKLIKIITLSRLFLSHYVVLVFYFLAFGVPVLRE